MAAKRYSVLQKKVKEMEEDINNIFDSPVEEVSEELVSDMYRRFGFIRSLLSAEIESHSSRPHHLHHIEQRLTDCETVFLEWDAFRKSHASENDTAANHIDTTSNCSCTESCYNDDDGGEVSDLSSHAYEDPESIYEEVPEAEEKPPEVVVNEEEPILNVIRKDERVMEDGKLASHEEVADMKYIKVWKPVSAVGDMKGRRSCIGKVGRVIKRTMMFALVVAGVTMPWFVGCIRYEREMEDVLCPT